MQRFIGVGLALQLVAGSALAQTTTPVTPAPVLTPPAVTQSVTPAPASIPPTAVQSPAGGLPGANSFTEGQARSRLEADGFSNVTDLAKDKDGIWRGKAMKGATQVAVGVDYKGNIVTN